MLKVLKFLLEQSLYVLVAFAVLILMVHMGWLSGTDEAKRRSNASPVVDYSKSPSFGDRVVYLTFQGEENYARYNCTKKSIEIQSNNEFNIPSGWYSYSRISEILIDEIDYGFIINDFILELKSSSNSACT